MTVTQTIVIKVVVRRVASDVRLVELGQSVGIIVDITIRPVVRQVAVIVPGVLRLIYVGLHSDFDETHQLLSLLITDELYNHNSSVVSRLLYNV
jgi:hypothetical protein